MINGTPESNTRWLLPDGIEELLPDQVRVLERLRRRLLDCYASWGYEQIMPPFIEYLESLQTGTGKDLDSQTFKVIDPLTGRLMGVRPDMTHQAARIDAHRMQQQHPVRLCYLGTVLHAYANGFSGSRAPLQIGAELYGHAGVESDLEIFDLMLTTLSLTKIEQVHVDLGHVGVFRALARQANLGRQFEETLFQALQRKSKPDIEQLLSSSGLDADMVSMLSKLSDLNGAFDVLGLARTTLSKAGPDVKAALDQLEKMANLVQKRFPTLPLHFDLAELRGYNYQTGLVFAAFVPEYGQEIARGGRYDHIGHVFGRARPATGFSTDLKVLMNLTQDPVEEVETQGIFVPCDEEIVLHTLVEELRSKGERVICALPGQIGTAKEMGCDRELVNKGGKWVVVPIDS